MCLHGKPVCSRGMFACLNSVHDGKFCCCKTVPDSSRPTSTLSLISLFALHVFLFCFFPLDKKPLANVTQTFCEFLLEQAMSALLLSSDHKKYPANTWNPDGNSGNNRALDFLHTMTECVNNSRKSGINR